MHDLCARSGARWGLQVGGAKLSEERSEGPRDQPRFEEGGSREPSDEELRARLEEELKRITAKDILLQTVVTLVNLGGQRLGLTEATQGDRDLDQVRMAIDGVRSLLPLLEADPEDAARVRPVRDALAQLQMAYASEAGAGGPAPGPASEPPPTGERASERTRPEDRPQKPGPSRLWVPPGSAE